MSLRKKSKIEDVVTILPDGEHPLFNLTEVSGVEAENGIVIFEIDGPKGFTGVITLLLRKLNCGLPTS